MDEFPIVLRRGGGQPVLVGQRRFLRAVLGGAAGPPGRAGLAAGWGRVGGAGGGAGGWGRVGGRQGVPRRPLFRLIPVAFRPGSAESSLPGFDDSGFATVTLPHTVAPLSWQDWDPAAWEKVWAYRKHFDAPPGARGMRVFLDFGAAMAHATVTLNGSDVADYLGGYLPFSAEITAALQPAGNVLAVRLDSTFNLDVPPGRRRRGQRVGGLLAARRDLPRRAAAGGAAPSWPTCSPSR